MSVVRQAKSFIDPLLTELFDASPLECCRIISQAMQVFFDLLEVFVAPNVRFCSCNKVWAVIDP